MAAEFYRKSTALYEEFKRRELHYLNVERSINSNYSTKDEVNLPLEDYLEKINRREKESEKSYKDLLKHLEEMDKRTDQMSLKLEKLNVLRNVAVSSNTTAWPSMDLAFDQTLNKPNYRNTFLSSTPAASFHPTINDRTLQMNPVFDYQSSKPYAQSQSTQTEHIFCEQCHYPFTRGSSGSIANAGKESLKLNETLYMECMTDFQSAINPNQDINREIVHTVDPNEIRNSQFILNDSMESPTKATVPGGNVVTNPTSVKQGVAKKLNFTNVEDTLTINDVSVSKNDVVPSPESKEMKTEVLDKNITQNQFRDQSIDGFDIKDHDKESSFATEAQMSPLKGRINEIPIQSDNCSKSKMFETVASKSDDGSINHEFDFLESERRPSMKNKTIEPVSNTIKSKEMPEKLKQDTKFENVLENNTGGTNSKANVDMKSQYNEVTDSEISKNVKNTGSFLTPSDTKMDSSLSEGSPSPAHHSADISNHSESDSFSEKETPFTASAAYQALLGNTAAPKTVQKAPSSSDSDSEDEIENVLASAVRRTSNINFDALTQVQRKEDKKSSVPDVKPKTDTKASKPASTGISQSKLSKSTRKVLGLETSSGSEVELEVKRTTNKIEEDSDEFDFFN